jgi:prepilin-type N-terminal cleavage/methylation domain-containing protein
MQRTRYEFRGAAGFTLFESMIVIALMAVLAAVTLPSLARYRTRSHARSHAERVMSVLQEARGQAITFGQPVLVFFDNPHPWDATADEVPGGTDFPDGVFARVVRSSNNDYVADDTDVITDVEVEGGLSDRVASYGEGENGETPFAGAAVPGEDGGGGTLGDLDQGSSLPLEDDSDLRGIAFTPQGMAVSIDGGVGAPISGGAALYVTDGNTAVYAVWLRPLGSVGIRTLNPETLQWN